MDRTDEREESERSPRSGERSLMANEAVDGRREKSDHPTKFLIFLKLRLE